MKSLLIIPMLNCEKYFLDILNQLKNHFEKIDILAIDYGSKDRTKILIENNKLNHLFLPLKTSYYQAISLGMLYAYKKEYDCVIEWDSASFIDSEYIINFLDEYKKNPKKEMILASRYLKQKPKSISLKILINIIRFTTKKNITDPNLSFRLYSKKIIKILAKKQNYYVSSEIIIHLIKQGIVFEEKQIFIKEKNKKNTEKWIKNWKLIFFTLFVIPFKKKGKNEK